MTVIQTKKRIPTYFLRLIIAMNPQAKLLRWNEFKDRFGTRKTTNFDLMAIAKRLNIHNFRVAMHDELLRLPKTTRNIVMNLDSSDGKGTHWVGFYNTPDYKLYFSSFGDPPSDTVIKFMNKTTTENTIREYNDFQLQDFGTQYCGQMSLYILYRLNFTNDSANDIVLSLKYNV